MHNKLKELEKTIVDLRAENTELRLKSCTLDLTKGHLSQCESALEERNNRIAELEKERDDEVLELKVLIHNLLLSVSQPQWGNDTAWFISDAEDKVDGVVKRVAEAHNLEQIRKGFWLGFEDARCHPEEMNILQQWEGTKVFNEAIKDGE